MILHVLLKMVSVWYLGTKHFIGCLHCNTLSQAANLRSESVSFYQGRNSFSHVTWAGLLIMHHCTQTPSWSALLPAADIWLAPTSLWCL